MPKEGFIYDGILFATKIFIDKLLPWEFFFLIFISFWAKLMTYAKEQDLKCSLGNGH